MAPAERWLAKQAGRPWSKVHGQILQKFDTNTLAGRHIVFDHLLPRPWAGSLRDGWRVSGRFRFHVDGHGYLRATQFSRPERKCRCRSGCMSEPDWLEGRRIRKHGTKYYWLEPAGLIRVSRMESRQTYRQARRLSAAEVARVKALSRCEVRDFVVDEVST